MGGFVQVIEWSTQRWDDVQALNEEWRARFPQMGPSRIVVCKDRDREGAFTTIVEFASYEEAMRNSNDPATSEFASRMQELCDGPAVFHNLDVLRQEVRMPSQTGAEATSPA